MLFALLLATVPAFAESVTVRLDLSDSMRAALARGDMQGIALAMGGRTVVTKEETTIFDVSPGKAVLRTILMARHGNYLLDQKDIDVDVKPGAVVTVPIQWIFVNGSVSLHGKPVRGDMNLIPSDVKRGPSYSVPFDDEGRFGVPLPHAGAYDAQVWWNNRSESARVPGIEMRGSEVRIELPVESSVTVHLDLSDSVRDAIARGDIKNVLVSIGNRSVKTTGTTVVIDNVAPGPAKLRVLLTTPADIYAVDPAGMPVDIVPGGEITVPIHALFVTGTIALHGKPLRGQMEVWPSAVSRGSWGIAVPFDEQGRFAFPLPHAGQYDLQVWWKGQDMTAKVPHVDFERTEAHIDLPEGTIAGRVVDASGKGVAGVHVRAALDAKLPRAIGGIATTDADGDFTVEGLIGGTWKLSALGQPAEAIVLANGGRKDGVLLRVGH